MKTAKKCTNFLLEVTVLICKVLFCHTTDLLNLTDSSVKLSANLLLQNLLLQQQKKKKKKKKKKRKRKKKKGINGQVSCSETFCHLLFLFKYPQTHLFYPSYYPSYRQKFPVIIKRGKFSSTTFFVLFCMTVSALENNDECRKHVFFFYAACYPSSDKKFPVTSIKSGFLWPIF